MIPIASFLAGSLLSLLLPVLLLIALVVWYVKFILRVPETADEGQADAPGSQPAVASPPDPSPSSPGG